jgi:hypothetical protein
MIIGSPLLLTLLALAPKSASAPAATSAEPASAAIYLSASAPSLTADGLSSLRVRIAVRDANGKPAPDDTTVSLHASLGQIADTVRTRGGVGVAEFVAGTVAGEADIEVNALETWSRLELPILPDRPAAVVLTGDRRTLRCDGSDSTELRVAVADAHGNLLDRPDVTVSIGSRHGGRIELLPAAEPGERLAWYHAPSGCNGQPVMVNASYQGLSSTLSLWLSPGESTGGVTLRINGVYNFGRLLAPTAELEGDVRLPDVFERLSASASVEMLVGSMQTPVEPASGSPYQLNSRVLLYSAYLGPKLAVYQGEGVSVWLGAGGDAHYFRVRDWSSLGSAPGYEHGWAFGAHGRAELALEAGPGALSLQLRYVYANPTSSSRYTGQVGGLGAGLGYRFAF